MPAGRSQVLQNIMGSRGKQRSGQQAVRDSNQNGRFLESNIGMNSSPNPIRDRDGDSRYIEHGPTTQAAAAQSAVFNICQSAMGQSNGFVANPANPSGQETQDSRQCSNIVTATFGGEQKFFSNNHSEPKKQEPVASGAPSAKVPDEVPSRESSGARKLSELMQQKNKNKMSQMIYGNQQMLGKLKQTNKTTQHLESQRIIVGKTQAIIKKQSVSKRKKEEAPTQR